MALNLSNSHAIYEPTSPRVTSPMNTSPRLCEQADRMHLWTRRRCARFCNIIAWSGRQMQESSIRVRVPEACEVWKCLPGLASITLQYAWWCTLTSCIYIYSAQQLKQQYRKLSCQTWFLFEGPCLPFSHGILMLKKNQAAASSSFPPTSAATVVNCREMERWIQWHFVSYNIMCIVRSSEAVHQEWLHKIKWVTSSLFLCRHN